MLNIDDVVGAGIFVDQGQSSKTVVRPELRADKLGVVVEFFDDCEHSLTRLFANIRLVIEHARDGLDRDTRGFGDVIDLRALNQRLWHSSRCCCRDSQKLRMRSSIRNFAHQ